MIVEIVTMSQELDLSDGSMTHLISFRLHTGEVIRSVISDESAERIVKAMAAIHAAPAPAITPSDDEGTFMAPPPPQQRGRAREVQSDEYGNPMSARPAPPNTDEDGIGSI